MFKSFEVIDIQLIPYFYILFYIRIISNLSNFVLLSDAECLFAHAKMFKDIA